MNIGLMAHDSKKELIINFCIAYKTILARHNLYATGTTGQMLEDNVGLKIVKFLPGHLGGGRQMGAQIELNQIDAVIFLRDPVGATGDDQSDFQRIEQIADVMNIPIATSLAAAEILILGIDRGNLDWRNLYK